MTKAFASLALAILIATPAFADEAPDTGASAPWAAITIFAVVIGMIAGIAIWRRRR